MEALLSIPSIFNSAVATLIFLLTQGLKWIFVKPWTRKIMNVRIQKAVNLLIYLIPFGLGILFEFLYSVLWLGGALDLYTGILRGSMAITLYGGFEFLYTVITGKKVHIKNDYESTEEGRAVLKLAADITSDGKVDKNDINAVESFLNKVK